MCIRDRRRCDLRIPRRPTSPHYCCTKRRFSAVSLSRGKTYERCFRQWKQGQGTTNTHGDWTMRTCKCEHWEVCPVCKPEWFDSEGNRLPPEPTPLQKANGRIGELEQQLASARAEVSELNNNVTICVCLLYTSPSPRDRTRSRMPSSA